MSRYYLHREGSPAEDRDDADLAEPGAVREWAKREALVLGIEQIREQGRLVLGSRVTVTDEKGREVTHACVGDAIQVSE